MPWAVQLVRDRVVAVAETHSHTVVVETALSCAIIGRHVNICQHGIPTGVTLSKTEPNYGTCKSAWWPTFKYSFSVVLRHFANAYCELLPNST